MNVYGKTDKQNYIYIYEGFRERKQTIQVNFNNNNNFLWQAKQNGC